jgi:Domain of unknown function (DUF4276)
MVAVKIYAEGGGEGELSDIQFRQAWAAFFKASGLKGRMPRVIRGKGRKRTFDLYTTAVATRAADELPLLLVDSEEAVRPEHTVWQHLQHRDGWHQPRGAGVDDAFLMVQVMETWFLADREALRSYFGPRLRENAFAEWPDLEAVPKATVLSTLENATANCKTAYRKGRVSFELLSSVDPARVEQRCPHARRLLTRLRTL